MRQDGVYKIGRGKNIVREYPLSYKRFYNKLSAITGISNAMIHLFMLRLIKVIVTTLHHDGKVIVPYIGIFTVKCVRAKRRSVMHFGKKKRYMVYEPAKDELKFRINKNLKKIFT